MVSRGPSPGVPINIADKFSDGSALVVGVVPALAASCGVSLEAILHLARAASARVLTSFALVSVSVLDPVCALAVGYLWSVLIVCLLALGAIMAFGILLIFALPDEIRSLLSHDLFTRVFIVIRLGEGVDRGADLPGEIGELGGGCRAFAQARHVEIAVRADIVRAESEGHLVVQESQVEAIVDTLAVVAFVLLVENERVVTLGQGSPDLCETGVLEGVSVLIHEELDLDVVGLAGVDRLVFTVASIGPKAGHALVSIGANATDTLLRA